jgi:hypothetical protein
MFRALSHQIFGSAAHHRVMRDVVVDYMRRNSGEYCVLFDAAPAFDDYCGAMGRDGTWGDELCLHAAAHCLGVDIHVITSNAQRWHLVFRPLGDEPNESRRAHIFLTYVFPVHYDDVQRLSPFGELWQELRGRLDRLVAEEAEWVELAPSRDPSEDSWVNIG